MVPQYELSARWVCRRLGIEIVDIGEFVCCGMNQVNLDIEGGHLLAAMNLALAEAEGLDIVTLCAACYGMLSETARELKDERRRAETNKRLSVIGLEYSGAVEVKHLSRVIYEDLGTERIRGEIRRDLSGLRVASHYGCHYLKPRHDLDGLDDPENPRTLDELISATGAESIGYETLLHC